MLKVIMTSKSGATKEHVLANDNKLTTKGIILCALDVLCDVCLVSMTWKLAKKIYKK